MSSLVFLSKEDYYEVRLGSMLASYDRDILTILYQPIIGCVALALYFTLWGEVKYNDFDSLKKHEVLAKKMGIEVNQILEGRKKLEGIGLLKTYKQKLDKNKYSFVYEIFAPKTPKDFFDDVLYKGLLSQKIGAKELERLAILFSNKENINPDLEEITSSFSDVYQIDDNETIKVMDIQTSRGRKSISIVSNFVLDDLLVELKNTAQISPSAFSNDDLNEISRIATLFGLDVLSMSEIISRIYNPNSEKHLDYDELMKYATKMKSGIRITSIENEQKEYSNNDKFGKKLNEFNEYSPYNFLKLRQNFTDPAPSDLKIINLLSQKYGLPAPVINVIVDYTLLMCDNILVKNYAEKIATSLTRKNITTALGACNELTKNRKAKKVNVEENTPKEEDNIDVDKLLKDIEGL